MFRTHRRIVVAIALLAVISAIVAVTASGDAGTSAATATITSTGTGSATLTPDSVVLAFGTDAERTTAEKAISAEAVLMRAVITALRPAGATSISTSSISLSIRYAQGGGPIVGFDAASSVQVSAAVSDAGAIIDAAVAAGATNVSGPWFASGQDQETVYRAALRDAVAEARERAEVIADRAGLTLGRIVSVDSGSNAFTVATPAAASALPIIPPAQQVNASVTVVFAAD